MQFSWGARGDSGGPPRALLRDSNGPELERAGVTWFVGGSVASSVHGRFRATHDVDVVADRVRGG